MKKTKQGKASSHGGRGRTPLMTTKSEALRLLFIHQNFPSPYLNLASHYAANSNNVVVAVGEAYKLRQSLPIPGVLLLGYDMPASTLSQDIHILAQSYDQQIRRGKAAQAVFEQLRSTGFIPHVIIGDPVWGEMLFVRQVFPDVPIFARAELYAAVPGPILGDSGRRFWDFDPENLYSSLDLDYALTYHAAALRTWADAQLLYTATHYQHQTFPPLLKQNIRVMHEGVRTDIYKPGPIRTLSLTPCSERIAPDNVALPKWACNKCTSLAPDMEVLVFFSRVLEPQRGWHSFIRALPEIQQRHPKLHCLIVGRSHGGYGPAPDTTKYGEGANWRDVLLEELKGQLDMERIHFLGNVSQAASIDIMRRAKAFVTMSSMLVPSWSPLEALACAVAMVTDSMATKREGIRHEEHALLVDFFDSLALCHAVCRLLENENLRKSLGKAGRQHILEHYDFAQVCLPQWKACLNELLQSPN